MIGLGWLSSIAFAAPAVLAALLALPAVWWLIRLTPPRPERRDFPPTALLADLVPTETTPAATPWWLLALRLALAACVILALAEPVHRPATALPGRDGPLWLIVDTGWPAAEDREAIRAAAEAALDRAAAESRPVLFATTGDGAGQLFEPVGADEARRRLAAAEPRPFADDRAALLAGLARAGERRPPGAVAWIAHGLDLGGDAAAFADGLVHAAAGAPLTLSLPARSTALALAGLDDRLDALVARVIRPADAAAATATVRAFDRRGRLLAESPAAFAAGAAEAAARFALPTEIRNDVARLAIAGHDTAGAVALIDERSRRRAVGLLAGSGLDAAQPLLAPTHYIDAALAPVADLRRPRAGELGPAVGELLDRGVAVILAADVGTFPAEAARRLGDWVTGGGILVRFAGPRLAAGRENDPLLPVGLRRGERSLGGALSWGRPRALAPFAPTGPFAGLAVPADVTVARQILAEPAPDLSERTWAALDDGTPLVTAARRGRGWLVLFHVGADTAWSDLPLSGTFVEMLRRITALAAAVPSKDDAGSAAPANRAVLPPVRLLDGAGRLGAPSPEARPIATADLDRLAPSREHPPGLWGDEAAPFALPTLRPDARLAALPDGVAASAGRVVRRGTDDAPTPLGPALLIAALVLALLDGGLALVGRLGGLRRRLLAGTFAALALTALLAPPPPAAAEEPARPSTAEAFARDGALHARLAYVLTGDDGLDEVSHRGLAVLGRALAERTAFEPDEPIGVDPARDDLAFFPLVYWPIAADRPLPAPAALDRIDAFMKHGGTVVFDTRDALDAAVAEPLGRRTPAADALARLLAGLDLPELEPVPADHVLGRTFYLLRDFPGRFDGPRPWVEATRRDGPDAADRPARPGDGVSPIVITANDLAGAWAAADDTAGPLPMVSTDPRGREMALRVGINLVMYVLTGNYKADQVHVPALLERLGR